jgi:hypothetical protein
VTTPGHPDQGPRPFYKRRSVIVTGVVIIVLAITVITDLPQHASLPVQIAGDKTVVQEVNADVGPCAFAANESFTLYADQKAHSLDQSELSKVPGLLNDDQSACSFTSDSIYELSSDIEVPGSAAGRPLGQMVSTVTLWATSDALSAIESIQALTNDPANASALAQLEKDERQLSSDRAEAEAQLSSADKLLGTKLPGLNLPALPDPSRG